MTRIAILGSGASAVVAAEFMLKQSEDLQVTIIDFAGMNHEISNSLSLGSAIKPSASAHLFEIPEIFNMNSATGTVRGTAAYGGWAEAWGATIVPFSDEEIHLNGMSQDEYRINAKKIRSFWQAGDLAFQKADLRILPQLFQSKLSIKNQYVSQVRPSELAIKAYDEDIDVACNQCGECLSGCPQNHIFKPSLIWPRILNAKNFRTLSHVWIERVSETSSGIVVELRSDSKTSKWEEFDFIFCGLGAIQTAGLLVRSGISKKVLIKDSQLVVVPFIDPLLRRTGTNQTRVSLSELFVFGRAPLLKDPIYCQLYGSSKSLTNTILGQTPWLKLMPNRIASSLLSRIGIAMQFLNSNQSGQIEVRMQADTVEVTALPSSKPRLILKVLPGFLLFKLRLIPLSLFARVYKVGDGYHFGSSFPFGNVSCGNSSDHLGRPNSMKRFSIIDSSVLNTVTARPNTFNSMVRASVTVDRVLSSEVFKQS
jgi:ferredoxin